MFVRSTTAALFAIVALCSAAFADDKQLIVELNNEAVVAINGKNWTEAILKLERALELDRTYTLARINLATANYYMGEELEQSGQFRRALKHYRHAGYYVTDNNPVFTKVTACAKADGVIRKMGKRPDNAADRLELGDAANTQADFIGAAVEYEAAQKLASSSDTTAKLKSAYQLLKSNKLMVDGDKND